MNFPENQPFASRPIYSDSYPLDEFYAAHGTRPVIARVLPADLPQPYRSLLAHQTDMTSTLEKFHREPLHVEVLERRARNNEYFRQVLLVLDQSRKRVEFGAIKIMLNLFPQEAQEEILLEKKPLGRILTSFRIPFTSRPSAFLRLEPDVFMQGALQLAAPRPLYGRRNSLLDQWEQPLAEIVEILPP